MRKVGSVIAKKRLAILVIGVTIILLAGGLNNVLLFSTNYFNTKPGYGFTVVSVTTTWWDCNWSYVKKITIDHLKVQADQTDFPVLLYEASDADLAAHAQDNGNDLVFVDHMNHTRYPYELEKFDGDTGELWAWVKVPNLSSTDDTILYLYYGNPECGSQQDAAGAWDTGYMMVQHLHQSSGVYVDSTSHKNNGSISNGAPSTVVGKIDGAQRFGGDDGIVIPSSDTMNPSFFTLEYWLKNTPPYTDTGMIRLTSRSDDSFDTAIDSNDNVSVYFYDSGDATWYDTGFDATPNTWYHLTWIYNGFAVMLYVNGTLVYNLDNQIFSTSGDLYLGSSSTMNRNFSGVLDEVRLSSITRTAAWLNTTYQNTNAPTTFSSFSTEVGILTQWTNRKKITIDHTQIPSTQNDFPVLISLPSDADLRSHAKTTGYDILFTDANVDWTTGTWKDALDYEIEHYDAATGALTAWVRIPTLSSETDTILYMYYNCTICTTDRSDSVGVWSSSYCGVWHMNDQTISSISDSTINHNNGTKASGNNPLQTDGKIDGAQRFGGDDGIVIPSSDTMNPSFFTLEYWLKNTPPYTDTGMIRLTSRSDDSFDTAIDSNDNVSVYFYDSGDATWYNTGFDATPNTWYHLTWIYNGFAVMLYVNGTYVYGLSPQTFTPGGDLELGTSPSMDHNFSGILDEVRLSTLALSNNDWITTNFRTMNSSATFFSIDVEERRD